MMSQEQIVCPRITKCGHIFCWPCVIQYLEFEKDRNWKKCPLCADPIYRLDLKPVIVSQNQDYKISSNITFDLMCRPKGVTVAKNKFKEANSS